MSSNRFLEHAISRAPNRAEKPRPERRLVAITGGKLAEEGHPRGGACAASFDALYREYRAFVARAVRRQGVAFASVDDVVQDVFLVVHRRLADYQARSSMKTWIFGIVIRTVRNHRRSMKRRDARLISSNDVTKVEPIQPGSHPGLNAEGIRILQGIIESLDEEKRSVFVLAKLEELRVPEIADRIGVSANTVHSRLRAAWRKVDQAAARHRARDTWRCPT